MEAQKGQRPRYLLSGLTTCALCGAGFSFRSEALRSELASLESRKSVLVSEAAVGVRVVPVGKPPLAELFRKKIAVITGDVVAGAIRPFIERIVIPPGQDKLRVHVNPGLADAIGGCGGGI